MNKKKCPCYSGKEYAKCCRPYHEGYRVPDAQALMRSRYAAYALGKSDYLIKTTHPQNSEFPTDFKAWAQDILDFSKQSSFEGLTILDFSDGETEAFVTFKAEIKQNGKDISFTERSRFKREASWLYLDGEML